MKKEFHHVYIGDAEKVLKKFQNNYFDFVFTSPPYFEARGTEQWNTYDDFLEKMYRIFKEVYRTIKQSRLVAVNVADYSIEGKRYPLGADFTRILVHEIGFNYVITVIWRKPAGVTSTYGQMAGNFLKYRNPLYFIPNQNFEYIIIVRKGEFRSDVISDEKLKFQYSEDFIEKKLRPFLEAVWDINPETTVRYHPLQFPEKLVEVALLLFTVPGDVVLDPFSGSGTLGAVCRRLGRSSVQIEIRKEYLDIIKKRLNWGVQKFGRQVEYKVFIEE